MDGGVSYIQKFSPATIKVHIVYILTYVYCLVSFLVYNHADVVMYTLSLC